MRSGLLILCVFFLFSCYEAPEVRGFDPDRWNAQISCEQNKIEQARLLLANESTLLTASQNEIKALLGDPDEHELYSRNQKFFYYNLSPACDSVPAKRLSLRFDALGRLKEINIFQTDL